ncbi:MAG: SPW repeat domain-containing protein [Candidatus Saccharimonadaceae bacterium]
MSYRFIPTKVHGALDYIVAIALILAPMIFGFTYVGGAAVIIPMVLGVGLLLYSLFTKYEWGLFKVLSMPYHLVIDVVASVFLLLSPFLFGFSMEALNVWLPHVAVGITVILVVIFSETQPRSPELQSKNNY